MFAELYHAEHGEYVAIEQEECPENPRSDLGMDYHLCRMGMFNQDYIQPDGNASERYGAFYTDYDACNEWKNEHGHEHGIREKYFYVLDVNGEHVYKLGCDLTARESRTIIEPDGVIEFVPEFAENCGVPAELANDEGYIIMTMRDELEEYTRWANGDVWGVIRYDEDGAPDDWPCWGYIGHETAMQEANVLDSDKISEGYRGSDALMLEVADCRDERE